jgi:hypothetical protein
MARSSIGQINAQKAAKILCCSVSHVYSLARRGVFTRYFIGVRSYRLAKKEIINFAKSNLKPLPAN